MTFEQVIFVNEVRPNEGTARVARLVYKTEISEHPKSLWDREISRVLWSGDRMTVILKTEGEING